MQRRGSRRYQASRQSFFSASALLSYCARMNCDKLSRFWGTTRMTPVRGLSISEIKKKAMDTAIGKIRNIRRPVRWAPYPISKLQQMAMTNINPQASIGMRFHHAACVYPCEFRTSFIPETARATIAVGCAAACVPTADHSALCSLAVSALIFSMLCGLRAV